ncbi:hypothetical protein [Streptomyces chartreusis]|uniref:hypothetical protein n=1 Tax=Streptomyces chartreusis TaxID=1969 RepID=UPI0038008601
MNRVLMTGSPASIGGVQVPAARPAEQSLSTHLYVEITNDLDDGHSTLAVATETNLGDLDEAGPFDAMRKIREARAQLDEAERLINEYAATVTLPAFIEQYGIELIEIELDGLADINPELAAGFKAVCARTNGVLVVAVPKGQSPVERVAIVRDLVLHLERQADAA